VKDLVFTMKQRSKSLQLMATKKALRMFSAHPETRALFVVGNQRSGTTMLLQQLNRHISVDVHHEYSNAMKYLKIKDLDYIKDIIEKSKAKVVIFKPLEDSHRTLAFLDKFRGSLAIWVFRHFSDVVNSSMSLGWGRHHKEYIRKIYNGEDFEYSEPLNLNERNVKLIRETYDPTTTPEACVALIWYLRNTIYFDYEMDDNEDILLVQYEQIVSNPVEQINNILSFAGLPYTKSVSKNIHAKSVHKQPRVQIGSGVRELCDSLYSKLVNALQANT